MSDEWRVVSFGRSILVLFAFNLTAPLFPIPQLKTQNSKLKT